MIIALLLFLSSLVPQSHPLDQFLFHGFNQTNISQILTLDGASMLKPNGALMLTNTSNQIIGHAFHSQPINLFDTNTSQSSSPNVSSFSTSIVFQIIPPNSRRGGHGLAFTLSPSPRFPGASPGHFLGIFNETTDELSSNHVFAVEFDTVNGYKDRLDSAGNHVGININNMSSIASEPAAYYKNDSDAKEEINLEGDPIQAWIEYDGVKKMINVTVAPAGLERPSKPLMYQSLDLSEIVQDKVYVGFSASTGLKSSSHYILGWSFRVNGEAPTLNLSLLPNLPPNQHSPSFNLQTEVLIVTLSALVVLGSMFLIYRWRRKPEILEDWELDCPHRFRYKDLHEATKGFKKSEVIGVGGFGAVYKGVLKSSKAEVAVKKIARNSIQGMREFVAEIESLGHLRHKHLVNLQGWCKQKDDLLLVYDYVPNGSLDSLLFNNTTNGALTWEQRINIVKGIASGLLYLHEEWVQVVIHRDVKSSNVLIDSDMNARLGDFGLARLYDHGKLSHTTNVVGTIGYIAPELARTGKASTTSDVFAFGVVLLELATGKRPVVWDHLVLFEYVLDCHQKGRILDAADPSLRSGYDPEEMELLLRLGMWCTHHRPESRPNMRHVVRYLNGNDQLPELENWTNVDSFEFAFGAFEVVSSVSGGSTSKSRPCSSIGGNISCNSIQIGR